MTSIFQLELAAPATPAEGVARIVQQVATAAGVVDSFDPPNLLHGNVTMRSGLWLYVDPDPADDFDQPDQFAADFGVHRTVSVGLQLNVVKQGVPQMRDMVTLVFGILDRMAGDAVLHYEYEEAWLLRRDGRLFVNNREDVWHPDLLAMIPHPYERARLEFSDVIPPS